MADVEAELDRLRADVLRVQVSWVDHDEDDGDLHETGWIMAVEGEIAVINCDCGPRTVRRPLSALTLGPSRPTEDTRP